MTTSAAETLRGIPGRDASASQRGYFYQAIVTALAWVELTDSQVLQIERADDLATVDGEVAQLSQVKDVKRTCTLTSSADYLEDVANHISLNPELDLRFVFISTSRMGLEVEEFRPNGRAGLEEWALVQNGADPEALIKVLDQLAKNPSRQHLAKFLQDRSPDQVVRDLIKRVTWATNSPGVSDLEIRLQDKIADISLIEFGIPKQKGRAIIDRVLQHVVRRAIDADPTNRTIRKQDLLDLIKKECLVHVMAHEYEQLERKAAVVDRLPTEPLNTRIQANLLQLRQTRHFPEARPDKQARDLAELVVDGGPYDSASSLVRSDALTWCARVLVEEDLEYSKNLLGQAIRLDHSVHSRLVQALVLSHEDPSGALETIADLRTPQSQTFRFAIRRRMSVLSATKWVKDSGLKPADFDPDGQFLVLSTLYNQKEWEGAFSWQVEIGEEAIEQSLSLTWISSLGLVASAVPEPLREVAFEGPPIGGELDLRATKGAQSARDLAASRFRAFYERAKLASLPYASSTALDYALWLNLRDQATRSSAKAEVCKLLIDDYEGFRWVPRALDAECLESPLKTLELLTRSLRLYGSLDTDAARALYAILSEALPTIAIETWEEFRVALQPYFQAPALIVLGTRLMARAGHRAEASAILASDPNLPDRLVSRIRRMFEQEEHRDAKLARVAVPVGELDLGGKYERVNDLIALGEIDQAIELLEQIFAVTESIHDAEKLLDLLLQKGRFEHAYDFFEANIEFTQASGRLKEQRFRVLFELGRWSQAEKFLDETGPESDPGQERRIQLAIYSCAWDKLSEVLVGTLDEDLTVDQLSQRALIAQAMNDPRLARKYAKRAISLSPEDPDLKFSSFILATRGGWEHDAEVGGWVKSAIASADESKNMQSKSLRELVGMMPGWREQTERINSGIRRGEIPFALAAKATNRPLSSVIAETLLQNARSPQFAQRVAMPLYAGVNREKIPVPASISFDASALLVMEYLGHLQAALDLFPRVFLPHSTGAWLFHDADACKFHQPSRVEDSQVLLHLLARNRVRVAPAPAEMSPALVRELGDDLAYLIGAASEDRARGREAYVIAPAPIHRPQSLGEEDASIGEQAELLRSTRAVVSSIARIGAISNPEATRALQTVSLHDQGWGDEADVPSGSVLYLSDLAVNYLRLAGMMEILPDAGLAVAVHPDLLKEAEALQVSQAGTEMTSAIIERIRVRVQNAYASGKAVCVSNPSEVEREERENVEHEDEVEGPVASVPSQKKIQKRISDGASEMLVELFGPTAPSSAVILDDRGMNKYLHLTASDGAQFAVQTSIQLLAWLEQSGVISSIEHQAARAKLRASGAIFVPHTSSELLEAVMECDVSDGELRESYAARAIRESILLCQSASMLTLPLEQAWLVGLTKAARDAIKALWGAEITDATIPRANWVFEQGRLSGFSSAFLGGFDLERVTNQDAFPIAQLALEPDIPRESRAKYKAWLENSYLRRLQSEKPLIFQAVFASVKFHLNAMLQEIKPTADLNDEGPIFIRLAQEWIDNLPHSLQERVLEDEQIVKDFQVTVERHVVLQGGARIARGALYQAASEVLAGAVERTVSDSSQREWRVQSSSSRIGVELVRQDESRRGPVLRAEFEEAALVCDSAQVRCEYVQTQLERGGIDADCADQWRAVAQARPFSIAEIDRLEAEIKRSPVQVESRIQKLLEEGRASSSDLVPLISSYYRRLVGGLGDSRDLDEFAASVREFSFGKDIVEQSKNALLRSVHSKLAPADIVSKLKPTEVSGLVAELGDAIDNWSLVGLIECLSVRGDLVSHLMPDFKRLIELLLTRVGGDLTELDLTASLCSMVDGTANRTSAFVGTPPFWRRLATFAHAGLMERVVRRVLESPPKFIEWADNFGPHFQIATLGDLPVEPRWSSYLLSGAQLKQELLGRSIAAISPHKGKLGDQAVETLVFGVGPGTLTGEVSAGLSALPGPLEGSSGTTQPVPQALLDLTFGHLDGEGCNAFEAARMLSTMSGLGSIPPRAVDRLVEAMEALEKAPEAAGSEDEISRVLVQVAHAAASCRERRLYDSVNRMLRSRPEMAFGGRIYVALTACAWTEDLDTWANSVNETVGWLSADLTRSNARHLLFVIETLCSVQPSLLPKVSAMVARIRGTAAQMSSRGFERERESANG